jgi:DNA-binding transcriptional ArsR family regulator
VPLLVKTFPVNAAAVDGPGAMVDVLKHPLRARIVSALAERHDVTIREVAERLREPPDQVRQHVEFLLAAGLAEVTGEDGLPGVVRRRYRIVPIEVGGGDSLDLEGRIEMGKATVRLMMGDLSTAAAAGTLSRRPDDFEVRTYGEVDEVCFKELVELHRTAYQGIFRALHEGKERTRESGKPGTEIVSALFFLEAPLWGARARRRPSRFLVDRSIDPDPQALTKACSQPVRGRILTALSERPDVTIREVADRLGEPRRRVRHHIETLVEMGLAVVTREDLSSVVERRYGATPTAVDVPPDSWSQEERLVFAKATMRMLAADFSVAAAAETFARGGEDLEVRIYGEVDDGCLEELADLHWSTYRGIRAKIEEGFERVMQSGEPGTEVVSALFSFEAPLWRHVIGR